MQGHPGDGAGAATALMCEGAGEVGGGAGGGAGTHDRAVDNESKATGMTPPAGAAHGLPSARISRLEIGSSANKHALLEHTLGGEAPAGPIKASYTP